tara:strand:+ start:26 stop:556 length:531 start_codon:yes stop_codon:yes gene_type:complete
MEACFSIDGGGCGPEFLDSSILYINLLVCLIFVVLLFSKAFKQDNTGIANILAIVFSVWIYVFKIIDSLFFAEYVLLFIILFSPYSYGTSFVVGGIISSKYFSKYYGEMIIKFGIAIISIWTLIEIFKIIEDIFYFPVLLTILSNVLIISFWFIYFKTLSSKTNVSLVSKNDPKDW